MNYYNDKIQYSGMLLW